MIITSLVVLFICLVIGAYIAYRVEKKHKEYGQLVLECECLHKRAEEARESLAQARAQEESSLSHLQEINSSISTNLKQLQSTKLSLETHEEAIREKLKAETKAIMDEYRVSQEQALLEAAKDFTEEFKIENSTKIAVAKELTARLDQLRQNEAVAIKLAQDKMSENHTDFHRLLLEDTELSDIKHLRSIEGMLHNPEPLNKVIWKVYYEKPYTDLIGRLDIGTKVVSGIYKITHIESQMSYIGQAVNIAARWKQHIKRGVGADTPTNNKLYPAMKKYGPEAFTFEIVEECPREKLDAQEDYWQEFYKAKEFGFSIK